MNVSDLRTTPFFTKEFVTREVQLYHHLGASSSQIPFLPARNSHVNPFVSIPAPHSFSESVPVKRLKTIGVDSPRQFFLSLLLQRPESLWETKLQENTSIRQWERCSEYFELLCSLLQETRRKYFRNLNQRICL